ncbi:MAG TPA: transposase [Mycobacterium sp.]|nr:transposase [Mycobacterium sp.]
MRNVLSRVPKGSQEMVAAAIRTVFAQPDAAAVGDQLDSIAGKLGRQSRRRRPCCGRQRSTSAPSPPSRPPWKKVWITNPLERVNKVIKRRTNVVGIFPNEAAVLRLAGSILLEVHDEWQVTERRYLSEASMAKLYESDNDGADTKEVGTKTKELLAG